MARAFGLVLWEMRIQARYYIYAGSVVVVALISGMVAITPVEMPAEAVAVLLLSESAVLAFFLVGVLILMERTEGTTSALGVAPIPAWIYVLARSASLAILAVVGGTVLIAIDFRGRADTGVLVLALALVSIMSVLGGFVAVGGKQTIDAYLGRAVPLMVVFAMPVIGFTGIVERWFFAVLPTHVSLLFFLGAFEPAALSRAEWIYAVGYHVVWIVVLWFWALRTFDRHIVGDGK